MKVKFPRDTAFRKQFFVPDSFAHPAKMDSQLLMWIVEHFTQPRETILDPMAGSGTSMLACQMGRDVVLVELEDKFCKMCRDNWEKVRMHPRLDSPMGECQIIQGDARNLEQVLDLSVDKIVSSPPYGNRLSDVAIDDGDPQRMGYRQSLSNLSVGAIITSPPYAETGVGDWKTGRAEFQAWVLNELATKGYIEWQGKRYTESEWRAMNHGRIDGRTTKGVHEHPTDGYGKAEGQIGNLPYGRIDSIITSPPYQAEPTVSAKYLKIRTETGRDITKPSSQYHKYSDKPVDAVITSPPYEEGLGHKDPRPTSFGMPRPHYTDDPRAENIGNLKSTSYLEAMYQVYSQCHKVLKDGGLMVLVTKNFIRNLKVMHLDYDTIHLCERAGFRFIERRYRKLPAQSFWRIIYQKQHPEVEKLEHEDVLIFKKQMPEGG